MSQNMMSSVIFIGIMFFTSIVFFLICRTFWARTIISIAGAIVALITSFTTDGFVCMLAYFISFFFLFGSFFGKKTGKYDVKRTIDFDSNTVTTEKRARTYTAGSIVASIVLALLFYTLSVQSTVLAIILPFLIIGFKVFRIKSHRRNREDEINSYDDDNDPDSTSDTTHF